MIVNWESRLISIILKIDTGITIDKQLQLQWNGQTLMK